MNFIASHGLGSVRQIGGADGQNIYPCPKILCNFIATLSLILANSIATRVSTRKWGLLIKEMCNQWLQFQSFKTKIPCEVIWQWDVSHHGQTERSAENQTKNKIWWIYRSISSYIHGQNVHGKLHAFYKHLQPQIWPRIFFKIGIKYL